MLALPARPLAGQPGRSERSHAGHELKARQPARTIRCCRRSSPTACMRLMAMAEQERRTGKALEQLWVVMQPVIAAEPAAAATPILPIGPRPCGLFFTGG